jgi:hypothetical protein
VEFFIKLNVCLGKFLKGRHQRVTDKAGIMMKRRGRNEGDKNVGAEKI